MSEYASDAGSEAKHVAKKAHDSAAGYAEAAADRFNSATADATREAAHAYDVTAERVGEASQQARHAAHDAYSTAAERVSGAADRLQDAGSDAKDAARDMYTTAAHAVDRVAERAEDRLDVAADKTNRVGRAAQDAASDAASDIAARVRHGAEDVRDNMQDRAQRGAENASSAADSAKKSAQDRYQTAAQNLSAEVQQTGQDTYLSDATDRAYKTAQSKSHAGADRVQGAAEHMLSGGDDPYRAAAESARRMRDALHDDEQPDMKTAADWGQPVTEAAAWGGRDQATGADSEQYQQSSGEMRTAAAPGGGRGSAQDRFQEGGQRANEDAANDEAQAVAGDAYEAPATAAGIDSSSAGRHHGDMALGDGENVRRDPNLVRGEFRPARDEGAMEAAAGLGRDLIAPEGVNTGINDLDAPQDVGLSSGDRIKEAYEAARTGVQEAENLMSQRSGGGGQAGSRHSDAYNAGGAMSDPESLVKSSTAAGAAQFAEHSKQQGGGKVGSGGAGAASQGRQHDEDQMNRQQ